MYTQLIEAEAVITGSQASTIQAWKGLEVMTLRNRTVLLLTEISNWLGASCTVRSKYRKDKCLKEYVVVQPSWLKFFFFNLTHFHTLPYPKRKGKKFLEFKIHLKYYLNATNSYIRRV